MNLCHFLDKNGSFEMKQVQKHTGLYFPLASECGLKSAVTPMLGGDAKMDQNHFLLEPTSIENLHNNKNFRNFWLCLEGRGAWSVTGGSLAQQALQFTEEEEPVTVQAGFMWHKTERTSAKLQLRGAVTSFVPVDENVEIHIFEMTNLGQQTLPITPVAAVPIYGRSADNIRDHRHVTSLLHRTRVTERGIEVEPTLSFDERGHQRGDSVYYVEGISAQGERPACFYPEVAVFIGEGGSLQQPEAVLRMGKTESAAVLPGTQIDGQESLGGLCFPKTTLAAGETKKYIVFVGICPRGEDPAAVTEKYRTLQQVEEELEKTKKYWTEKVNVSYHTGDPQFDNFMKWISFQPELRRLFGCSFLPHHDYGRGGRGWRDLWQDCLALLLMNPDGVRGMLLGNFAGVRMDGTNATIIGSKVGEFKADRNAITRVWMDHGVWPAITTKLYIDQTGDFDILNQDVSYFKDPQAKRGTSSDPAWTPGETWQLDTDGNLYQGSVLEHLLLQNLAEFWEVGEHGHCLLRGADWNDAIDMASHRGESVAFTNAYAGNLLALADLIEEQGRLGVKEYAILEEISILLQDDPALYDSVDERHLVLNSYLDTCVHRVSGKRMALSGELLAGNLRRKGHWIQKHIRETEWTCDADGNGWFNGYYDDNGRKVEGTFESGVRMMLTGQVFSIMNGTASVEQTAEIIKSADKYLFDPACGGYRLNTDFKEVKMDMGRMFGFAYGEKENGGVFSHMAVMYANALYRRGFAREGFRSLNALYEQAMNTDISHIYPGIPEYFGRGGRGLYHYLTGAGSWYMLTVVQEMFGVRGDKGDLLIRPALLAGQFDEQSTAGIELLFGGKQWQIEFRNPERKDCSSCRSAEAQLDGEAIMTEGAAVRISGETVQALDDSVHKVVLTLR